MQSTKHTTPILVITGPTASGKTGLAIELARQFNGEIVGADSMQVYKGMNIGTDTPTRVQLGGVVHHLIDIVAPDEEYDAARFIKDADNAIAQIHKRGKRVIVAGGTGLYLRMLLKGMQQSPPPNVELRQELTQKGETEGWPSLHAQLAKVDAAAHQRLHPNDGVRIVRALEVYLQTGKPLSQWQQEHRFSSLRYPHRTIGIMRPKEELNQRINQRVDEMFEQGFIDEVIALRNNGYGDELKPMQALGYKPINQYLRKEISLQEANEQTKTTTRRFAKRQRTWFKKESEMIWVSPELSQVIEAAGEYVK